MEECRFKVAAAKPACTIQSKKLGLETTLAHEAYWVCGESGEVQVNHNKFVEKHQHIIGLTLLHFFDLFSLTSWIALSVEDLLISLIL